MRYFYRIICLIALSSQIACSPVNTIQVFDQQQAAILLNEHMNTKPTAQRIALHLPKKSHWRRLDMSLIGKGSPIMLVPQDQTEQNWQESIRTYIRSYTNEPDMTAQEFMLNDWQDLKAHCKRVATNIIESDRDTILYRSKLSGCKLEHDQIRITRVFNGEDAVYAVYYSALPNAATSSHLALMEAVIANTQLVRQPG